MFWLRKPGGSQLLVAKPARCVLCVSMLRFHIWFCLRALKRTEPDREDIKTEHVMPSPEYVFANYAFRHDVYGLLQITAQKTQSYAIRRKTYFGQYTNTCRWSGYLLPCDKERVWRITCPLSNLWRWCGDYQQYSCCIGVRLFRICYRMFVYWSSSPCSRTRPRSSDAQVRNLV